MRWLLSILLLVVGSSNAQQSEGPRLDQKNKPTKQQNAPHDTPKLALPITFTPSDLNKPPSETTRSASPQRHSPFPDLKDISDMLAGWALVVVGFFGVRIALRTLRAIENQVGSNQQSAEAALRQAVTAEEQTASAIRATELSERTILLTQRADVLVDGFKISTYPKLRNDSVLSLRVKNFGSTRANNVDIIAKIFNPDAAGPVPMNPLHSTVLGASDDMACSFQAIGEWTTSDTFRRISEGLVVLRFEAEIRYSDVFGKPHVTKCSGVFRPEICAFVMDADTEAD
jgi:hypothetical protein